MPTPLLLATKNKGKAKEFQEMLGSEWTILTANDVPDLPDVIEDGKTFEANARKKALESGTVFPGLVLADDSGLEVDALNGEPGIFSARFAGEPSNDLKNNEFLLQKLQGIPEQERGAQFVCALALTRGTEVLGLFKGVLRGTILDQPRGHEGFGYDPLFVPEGYTQTFGELGSEIKHRISHRSQALKSLLEGLKRLNS